MANINVEVSDELIGNLKKLGYEIVRIGNPKNGEIFLSYAASDNTVREKDIIDAKGTIYYDMRVIVRKILKWPPFLSDKCYAFKLVSKGDSSPSYVNIYDEFGGYNSVRIEMLTYDFREYPVDVRIMRKDCAT